MAKQVLVKEVPVQEVQVQDVSAPKPRKQRSDKGVKRGPRKYKEASV